MVAQGLQQGFFAKWRPVAGSFSGGKMQFVVEVAGPSFTKDKDVARRWMIACLRGVRDYTKAFTNKEGRPQVVDILTKNTTVSDPKVYDVMAVNSIDPNGGVVTDTLVTAHKFYQDSGQYTGKKTFMDMLDLSYADYAAQKLGKQ